MVTSSLPAPHPLTTVEHLNAWLGMAAKHSGGRASTTGERAAALAVLCEYRKLTKGHDSTVMRNAESVLSRPWARDLVHRSPAK